MKKTIKFILVFVALVSTFTLCTVSVFADANSAANLDQVKIYDKNTGYWVDVTSNSTWTPTTGTLQVAHDETSRLFGGLAVLFEMAGYVRVESGYYFTCSFTFSDAFTVSSVIPSPPSFDCIVATTDGQSHALTGVWTLDSASAMWNVKFYGSIGDGEELRIETVYFETDMPSVSDSTSNTPGSGNYSVDILFEFTTEMTAEMKMHQELITEIQSSTDQITNGWETDDNSSSEVGGLTGDMESAESEALGGKTDEEIQADINNALNGDGLPSADSGGVIAVAETFDGLLEVFGLDYQAVLVLALVLGLASLLVGHSYRARGD